jgi:hypothetical protein
VEVAKKKLEESNTALRTIFRDNERMDEANNKIKAEYESNKGQLDKEQETLEALLLES